MVVWSFVLSGVALVGTWLIGRKIRVGWLVNTGLQVLWLVYAIVTRQWGFILGAVAFGWVNGHSWWRWRREEAIDRESVRVPR